MSYIGSTPTTQSFIAGTDQFTGTGAQTSWTLSRFVNSTNDIEVVIANVIQNPTSYSVSGNTLTITPAVGNAVAFYVRYLSTTLQSVTLPQGITIQFNNGAVGAPSITFSGDTNTGIYSPTADTLAFVEGGTEVMRIDSSGNIGIGTTSPAVLLHTQSTTATTNAVTQVLRIDSQSSGTPASGIGVGMQFATGTAAGNTEIGATIEAITTDVTSTSEDFDLSFKTMAAGAAAAERARIKSTGDFQFNSGYGSVATAYGCRAWVNFDGTSNTANLSGTYSQSGTTVTVTATAHGLIAGNVIYADATSGTAVDGIYTVATVISSSQFTYTAGTSLTTSGNITLRRNTIRASGNVSSIADNGTGDYTVNFTTAMPDANYAAVGTSSANVTGSTGRIFSAPISAAPTTSAIRVATASAANTAEDQQYIQVAIFR